MEKKELLLSLRKLLTESQSMNPVDSSFFLENGIREVVRKLENEKSSVIGELSYKINIDDQEAKDHLKELESKLEYTNSLIELIRTNLSLVNSRFAIKKLDYSEGDTRG